MNAPSSIQAFIDAAADSVGREIARLRAEAKREEEIRQAEYRARCAELDSRILAAASLEKEVSERLALLKDGRDGHDVEDIEVRQNGRTAEFGFTVGGTRTIFELELPEGAPGKNGDRGPEGRMAAVEPWTDQIHYEGAIRSHNGATFQALRDTAKEPPSEDWACLAERGSDGTDGKSLNPRRLWSADEEYGRLDVVALNGGSFVALTDNPGPCPGDGWMLLTSQGKTGRPGDPGRPGPPVKGMAIDDNAVLTLTNADGSTITCDLYPLLSRLDRKGL